MFRLGLGFEADGLETEAYLDLDPALGGGGLARHPAKVGGEGVRCRVVHLRAVGDVDGVQAELHGDAFCHLHVLGHVGVPLLGLVAAKAFDAGGEDALVEAIGAAGGGWCQYFWRYRRKLLPHQP